MPAAVSGGQLGCRMTGRLAVTQPGLRETRALPPPSDWLQQETAEAQTRALGRPGPLTLGTPPE